MASNNPFEKLKVRQESDDDDEENFKELIDKKIKIFKNKEKFEIKREKENQNILTNYFKEIATENFLNDFIEHKNNTQ